MGDNPDGDSSDTDDDDDDDLYEVYPRPGFVYRFTWPGTDLFYIGSTFGMKDRLKVHMRRGRAVGVGGRGSKLYNAMRENSNWEWEYLFRGLVNSGRELREKEQEFINDARTSAGILNSYNAIDGLLNTHNVLGVNKNSKAEGNHRRYIEKKAEIDARNTTWMNKRVACPHCPEDEYGPQTYSQGYLKAHIRRRHPEVEQTDRRRTE